MKRSIFIVIALLATGISSAFAGEDKSGRWFDRLDTNSDGVITQAEMEARRAERFAKFDADGDGMISPEEFNARSAARFSGADQDRNGEITRQEFTEALQQWRKKHTQGQ